MARSQRVIIKHIKELLSDRQPRTARRIMRDLGDLNFKFTPTLFGLNNILGNNKEFVTISHARRRRNDGGYYPIAIWSLSKFME